MKRALTLVAAALLVATTVSACGNADAADERAQTQSNQREGAQQQGDAGAARMPGSRPGSGKVAAVSGSTAQVQSRDRQTAVTWDAATVFTRQATAKLADVVVGSCVMVVGATGDSGGSTDAVTAASVRITEAVDGECVGGFGGGRGGAPGGGRLSGAPSDLPDGAPTDPPSDGPDGGPNGRPEGNPNGAPGRFAVGKVTAVTASGFTVESVMPNRPDGDGDGQQAETSPRTVAVTGDTTYSKTVAGAASDVKVGVCVTTQGESDSTGAVTATSMAISDAVDGECSGGFGGFGGPRGTGGSGERGADL